MNTRSLFYITTALAFIAGQTVYGQASQGHANPSKVDSIPDAVVRRIHKSVLTIDPHLDIPADFGQPGSDGQFGLAKLEAGDLDVATVALFASTAKKTPENIAAANKEVQTKLAAIRQFVAQHPDRLAFATTAADLEQIPASGKHAILLSFLNAFSLNGDVSQIPPLYKDGVRVLGLAHAGNNDFTDSSRPVPGFGDTPDAAGGLTQLGKQAVAALNRLGIIIDVSQLTPAALFQTLKLTKAPVLATHSAVRGRVDATRNLSNDELKAIAANGGVVSIVAFPAYLHVSEQQKRDYLKNVWEPFGLKPGDDAKSRLDVDTYKKYQAAYRNYSSNGWQYATLTDYLDAVDYAVRLIGIDHVGLASDFNHGGGVRGYAHVGETPNVTRELLKRGYSETDIRKLWGGNFLRVFRQVELTAKQGQPAKTLTRK